MSSSNSGISCLWLLLSSLTNNQNNDGIIGDGSYNIINSGNIQVNISQVTKADDEDVELDGLLNGFVSGGALHNFSGSPAQCHPGTRKIIRKEIGEWVDNINLTKSPLLWLNGSAAVGKSVIAKTIAESHSQVIATFFFSTGSDHIITLVPTLARQLARRIPETKQPIIASLKNNPSLLMSEFEVQFDHLIAQPLRECKVTLTYLPVMVIDGVDRCTDENMLLRSLQILVRLAESGNMPLRFIICSRPEPRIRDILERIHDDEAGQSQEIHDDFTDRFDRISNHPVISNIQVGFSEECREDIAKYLIDKFNEIRQPRESPTPRLQQRDVLDLVEKSSGQFLYASSIVRHLDHSHPMDVLKMARHNSLSTPDLDKLYKAILKQALDEIRSREQEGGPDYGKEVRILKDALAMVIVFEESNHFSDAQENFAVIESLLGLEKGRLTMKLRKMHSVLSIVPGKSVRVYHRSFLHFLQSRERSREYYIAYPRALRRFLVLLARAGLRYTVMNWFGQLQDDDNKLRRGIESMALAFRRNHFKQSRSPMILLALHHLIHFFLLPFLLPSLWQFTQQIIYAPTFSPVFIPHFLFLAFFYILILSSGSLIISLTIYTSLFNYSSIPLFHPFLHPHFVTMVRILFASRLPSIVLFSSSLLFLLFSFPIGSKATLS